LNDSQKIKKPLGRRDAIKRLKQRTCEEGCNQKTQETNFISACYFAFNFGQLKFLPYNLFCPLRNPTQQLSYLFSYFQKFGKPVCGIDFDVSQKQKT